MKLCTLSAILFSSIESFAGAQEVDYSKLDYSNVDFSSIDYHGSYFTITGGAPLVSERIDPIVSPGQSPSNHVHEIFGSNKFSADWDYDTAQSAECNNMGPKADHSSYW